MCYMKHAATNRKPIAKAKSITRKPISKSTDKATKPGEKKYKSIVSAGQNLKLKPTKKTASRKPVQSVRRTAKKAEPFKSAKTAKSKVVEKVKPTVPKVKANSSTKKITSAGEKTRAVTNNGSGKTNLRKVKSVGSSKLIKPKNQTLKPAASVKKVKPVEVSKKANASIRSPKTLAKKIKTTVSAPSSNTKSAKSSAVGTVKKAKLVKLQINTPVKKAKLTAKIQTGVSVKKSKSENENTKTIVSFKKAESKIAEKNKNKVQTTKIPNATKTKLQTSKAVSPVKKIEPVEKKIKLKSMKLAGKVSKRINVKPIKNKIEPTKLPAVRKAIKKKTKPISSAVFRGKKDRYDFQVFPIDAVFEDVSAIYIISKRKIDKRKRAHHALVCIGQTDSILGEMKKHKKGKCVKQHQANTISILPEANEKTRLKIETDLKAAHSIPCIHA